MNNVKMIIEYDGTHYHGWQKQQNAIGIQEILEVAAEKIVGHPVEIIGSGRTDSGVHAYGQVVNFETSTNIPIDKLPFALNTVLPQDIVVKHAEFVSQEFHARYQAKGKKYRYIIRNTKFPSAIMRNREYHCVYKLDKELMKSAAKIFEGTHDFKGLSSSGSNVKDTQRTILKADIVMDGDLIIFEVEGTGFLYNMVRIMVGTLVDIGRGKIPIENIQAVFENGDRNLAGATAPPQGLYLVEVFY